MTKFMIALIAALTAILTGCGPESASPAAPVSTQAETPVTTIPLTFTLSKKGAVTYPLQIAEICYQKHKYLVTQTGGISPKISPTGASVVESCQ